MDLPSTCGSGGLEGQGLQTAMGRMVTRTKLVNQNHAEMEKDQKTLVLGCYTILRFEEEGPEWWRRAGTRLI